MLFAMFVGNRFYSAESAMFDSTFQTDETPNLMAVENQSPRRSRGGGDGTSRANQDIYNGRLFSRATSDECSEETGLAAASLARNQSY